VGLALFDLDNTLIAGDSDYLWGRFLVEQGMVDEVHYEKENQRFYDEYTRGELDIEEFLAFSLKPLSQYPYQQLIELRKQFVKEKIEPILLPAAQRLVDAHRSKDRTIVIITATNEFVTAPIAELYGADVLIATRPERKAGEFTGLVDGIPCFQEGKVTRLNDWLLTQQRTFDESWFFSDSNNDKALLEWVKNPVVVDADTMLSELAAERGWPAITLREDASFELSPALY